MSDKVKLPKEVAEAIQIQRNKEGYTNYGMIQLWERMKYPEHLNDNLKIMKSYFKDRPADLYVEVIVNGYEVEQTPGDKVKAQFDEWQQMHYNSTKFEDRVQLTERMNGMLKTLDIFGIKIEGVNT